MTGVDLQQLLLEKWGRSYDIQLRRIKDKVHVQVMWKYLEQASFPLSESEYLEHLNAIANYLHEWGGFSQFQAFIRETRERPRLGKAVSLALDLGERASEWLISDQWPVGLLSEQYTVFKLRIGYFNTNARTPHSPTSHSPIPFSRHKKGVKVKPNAYFWFNGSD